MSKHKIIIKTPLITYEHKYNTKDELFQVFSMGMFTRGKKFELKMSAFNTFVKSNNLEIIKMVVANVDWNEYLIKIE